MQLSLQKVLSKFSSRVNRLDSHPLTTFMYYILFSEILLLGTLTTSCMLPVDIIFHTFFIVLFPLSMSILLHYYVYYYYIQ